MFFYILLFFSLFLYIFFSFIVVLTVIIFHFICTDLCFNRKLPKKLLKNTAASQKTPATVTDQPYANKPASLKQIPP